jgi:hypothetical protein
LNGVYSEMAIVVPVNRQCGICKSGGKQVINAMELQSHPLFQQGYRQFEQAQYFDAHESWEALWLALPNPSAQRDLLQGLIQVTVAFHHHQHGNPVGAKNLLQKATDRFNRLTLPAWLTADPVYLKATALKNQLRGNERSDTNSRFK